MNFKVVPATKEHLQIFYGNEKWKKIADCAMHAYVGLIGEKMVAIGGVAFTTEVPVAFIETSDEAKKCEGYAKQLIKTANEVMAYAKKHCNMLYAVPVDTQAARNFLEHYGFNKVNHVPDSGDVLIYKWVR